MAGTFAYIDMSEVERLAHNLALSAVVTEGLVDSAVAGAAENAAQRAQNLAPVGETGVLRDTIYAHRHFGANRDGERADWAITAPAPYAAYVEFGAPANNQAPQPFMRPASDDFAVEIERTLMGFIRPFGR